MRRLAAAALLALAPTSAFADPALDSIEIEFMRLINEYRAANGLGCLSISPTMDVAADWMSREMGEQGFFSHNEPPCDESGCTGRDPFDRITDFGHTGWHTAGENIAAGFTTAQDVFEAWRNSPGHNANMLGENFTAMGIARVEVPGSSFGIYWTNDFSDRIDGPLRCEDGLPPVGYGAPDGTGGSGGTTGNGGSGGGSSHGGSGGSGGGFTGWGGDTDAADDGGDGGGCASAGGTLSLLGLALGLAALRRR